MASKNNGDGKLNVKRARRRLNQNNTNTTDNQVSMDVADVEEKNTESCLDMETDNPSHQTDENNKLNNQLHTLDSVTGEIDKQIVNISESLTQTLGSAETPIDIDLAADFEPTTSMNTDCNAEGHEGISENDLRTERFDDGVCSVASTESLTARENRHSSQVTHDDDDSVVETGETSHGLSTQASVDGECGTMEEPKKELQTETKRKRGRPKKNAIQDEAKKLSQREVREELLELLPEPGESKFSKEASQKVRKLLRSMKKLCCPKEGCEKVFSNVTGFQYHAVRCGGISISFTCEICGGKYGSAEGLTYHKRNSHPSDKTMAEKNTTDQQDDIEPEVDSSSKKQRSKYSFRERCGSNKYASENDTQGTQMDDDYNDFDYSSDESERTSKSLHSKSWMKYCEKLGEDAGGDPQFSTEFTNLSIISETLKQGAKLRCPKKCGRYFRIAKNAYQHIKECKGANEKYSCKLCGKVLLSMPGMKNHILSKHRRKEHNSDNDEESEFSEGEPQPVKVSRTSKPRSERSSKIDYEEKTRAWCEAFLAKTSLSCWRPSLKHWKKLPVSEAEDYLPVRKMSVIFRIESIVKENCDQEEDGEHQLPLFSSSPINSDGGVCNVIFNVGGPVWAMDWAPVPVNEINRDQYLAISCHSDPEKKHLLSECYKEKGVLQIWRVPKLQNGKRPTEQPEFCLGIVHDYGPLWDIRWCPSGAWDTPSLPAGELRRLGLLAVACADGKVRIFSIPFPCSLVEKGDCKDGNTSEDLLYRAVPQLELSPGSLCRKYGNECGATWRVSWQPINGHSKVVASYTDGTVAVWNLKTEDRILKATSQDGLTDSIFPISHFQSHNSIVRALAWCPSEPNYIATGSYDKLIKIWDLRHSSQPVLQFEKVMWCYQMSWPLHWGLLLYNTDVSRVRGTRSLDYFSSCRCDSRNSHVTSCCISHCAGGWDNDYSHWTNLVASVDAAGVISINFISEALSKISSRMKRTIFRAFAEPIVQHQHKTVPEQNIENGCTDSNKEKEDHFKIVFKDAHPLSAKTTEEDELSNDKAYVQPDQPTHTALHKVCWNPNLSSYYWLATAGNTGLVRLCYVDKLK